MLASEAFTLLERDLRSVVPMSEHAIPAGGGLHLVPLRVVGDSRPGPAWASPPNEVLVEGRHPRGGLRLQASGNPAVIIRGEPIPGGTARRDNVVFPGDWVPSERAQGESLPLLPFEAEIGGVALYSRRQEIVGLTLSGRPEVGARLLRVAMRDFRVRPSVEVGFADDAPSEVRTHECIQQTIAHAVDDLLRRSSWRVRCVGEVARVRLSGRHGIRAWICPTGVLLARGFEVSMRPRSATPRLRRPRREPSSQRELFEAGQPNSPQAPRWW